MLRLITVLLLALFVASCGNEVPKMGPDGKPLPKLYALSDQDPATVQFRVLDALNALRSSAGLPLLSINSQLNAAAATHSRDMSIQNRPWHFGSDGSSPLDRVKRVGYEHALVGEVISETFETELETLSAWVDEAGTRRVLLDTTATDIGFYWYQEPSGKIWWTLVLGSGPDHEEDLITSES